MKQNTDNQSKSKEAKAAQPKKPRRIPQKRLQDATPLDTADDDEYDDAWLPAYEDSRPTDKIVEKDWVKVNKPATSR